jgi:uncharacterized protein
MFERTPWASLLEARLKAFPAVALVGSRQVGKTSLAKRIAETRDPPGVYLDLELESGRAKLADAEGYLRPLADRLVVLDEVQRMPDLFATLRGLIDERRTPGRFLVLGSAAPSMLAQTSESLAGRIAYVELPPFGIQEVAKDADDAVVRRLWLRGGYPDSFLARSDADSAAWRDAFVRGYVERDLPQLGVQVPATTMLRFWRMLAHVQAQTWHGARIASGLGVSQPTIRRYLDTMTDACLVRQLPPLVANLGKRLVKSPKVFVRDSGILHALHGLPDRDALLGHPVAGSSFEGLVVEQTLGLLGDRADAAFYRTQTGVELDLVLTVRGERVGVEVKLTSAPKLGRGLRTAIEDVACKRAYVVVPTGERFRMDERVEAIPVAQFIRDVVLPLQDGRPIP